MAKDWWNDCELGLNGNNSIVEIKLQAWSKCPKVLPFGPGSSHQINFASYFMQTFCEAISYVSFTESDTVTLYKQTNRRGFMLHWYMSKPSYE